MISSAWLLGRRVWVSANSPAMLGIDRELVTEARAAHSPMWSPTESRPVLLRGGDEGA